ncbi:uncharacterized protein PITG_06503 [Phytophthora infestans T30-4]|uniref:Uncharacterized protein n=1 Tax=Phytophthora infestans (strain T30-4) TaxID=403677 RepID=D0N502_PHYIT|nr:uncharacterized protein PITG_06503 [Phytophthora infestans T30-4]EEY69960.1 hypothetical protein PITG_06503 [Phytophthora infestans T30-4]|eukprot:XP_002998607.1 hypothetical protein PITG_06503 [Phytophthora infestans T30-4]
MANFGGHFFCNESGDACSPAGPQILNCLRLSALSGSPATAHRPSSTDPGARAAHHAHPSSLSPPPRPTATLAAAPTAHDALRTEISLERLLYSFTTARTHHD